MTDPRKISEKVFQEEVRKAALIHGWRYFHNWSAIHSPKGFPDTVLVHAKKRQLIFAELKSETGKLSDMQQEWIEDLQVLQSFAEALGCKVLACYVWRPSQIDEIWEVLK